MLGDFFEDFDDCVGVQMKDELLDKDMFSLTNGERYHLSVYCVVLICCCVNVCC